jgi:hypothetical protein
LDPNALIGAWNIVDRNTANSVTSFARTAIANVGGVVKTRDFEIPGGCQSTQTVLTPEPVNGTFSGGGGAFTGILLDEDSAVGVEVKTSSSFVVTLDQPHGRDGLPTLLKPLTCCAT